MSIGVGCANFLYCLQTQRQKASRYCLSISDYYWLYLHLLNYFSFTSAVVSVTQTSSIRVIYFNKTGVRLQYRTYQPILPTKTRVDIIGLPLGEPSYNYRPTAELSASSILATLPCFLVSRVFFIHSYSVISQVNAETTVVAYLCRTFRFRAQLLSRQISVHRT